MPRRKNLLAYMIRQGSALWDNALLFSKVPVLLFLLVAINIVLHSCQHFFVASFTDFRHSDSCAEALCFISKPSWCWDTIPDTCNLKRDLIWLLVSEIWSLFSWLQDRNIVVERCIWAKMLNSCQQGHRLWQQCQTQRDEGSDTVPKVVHPWLTVNTW